MKSKPMALIIEDDEDLNAIFGFALEKAGYLVRSVYDGITAQNFLAGAVPTLIILDLHMPRVGGDVVLKQIRANDRLKNVNVIIATADAAFAQAMQFRSELVLLKPISFSQLSMLASHFMPKSTAAESEN